MTNTYQSQLDDSLLKLIYLNCQPFSLTENEGFKQFVHLLNPAYKLPSYQKPHCLLLMKSYLMKPK